MKEVKAYRCEHCGQLFMTEWRCKRHEDTYCKRNPQIRALCYICKHYEAADETEQLDFDEYSPNYDMDMPMSIIATPNKCNALGCKLYNKKHLCERNEGVFQDYDYRAMKTLRDGGCEHYEEI
jgi:hypothetical protein